MNNPEEVKGGGGFMPGIKGFVIYSSGGVWKFSRTKILMWSRIRCKIQTWTIETVQQVKIFAVKSIFL